MKLHQFFAEIVIFLSVFFIYVLPPILVSASDFTGFAAWTFPINELVFAICSFFLLLYLDKKLEKNSFFSSSVGNKKLSFFINSGKTLITFGFLCCFSAFMEFIAYAAHFSNNSTVIVPSGLFENTCFFLKFLLAVFYEEIIFRIYLPEESKRLIIKKIKNKKIACVITEFTIALLFAFAHRYLGWPAVINAFAAHLALRICYIKTENFFTIFMAHFFYNLMSFFLSAAL